MYINLYILLFNFTYLFFLSFSLNIFVSFIFIALFPNCHLALVLLSSLYFSYFCSGRQNFWYTLFTRSIYCTLFSLDCFDFAYGCICICVYSVTLFIVIINICLYVGLLQFCEVYLFFFPLFSFFFHFFFFSNFYILIFKPIIFFYIYSLFAFPTVLFTLKLIFNECKSSSSTSM